MEKGALGLFFELNYIIWFVNTFPAPVPKDGSTEERKEDFKNMYNWLYINYFYLFFCLFMSMIVACIYKSMDSKAKQLQKVGN